MGESLVRRGKIKFLNYGTLPNELQKLNQTLTDPLFKKVMLELLC